MADLTQSAAPGQLPGGVAQAEDLYTSVAKLQDNSRNESPTRRNFEDWSLSNPSGQTGIVVRNTFIDVCPLEQESDPENDACASPHRRNVSAPPSPTRNRNPWAEENAQYVDSDQEEEEDPGSIPNYQWAPDAGLLKAEHMGEQGQPTWLPGPPGSPKKAPRGPPGSPKKIPAKPKLRPDEADSGKPLLGEFLKGGMSLAGMHGGAPTDPYAAYGLAPATGGDAGSRLSTDFSAGLGGIFGSGDGLGVFGSAGPAAGSLDHHGLSTLPPGGPGGGLDPHALGMLPPPGPPVGGYGSLAEGYAASQGYGSLAEGYAASQGYGGLAEGYPQGLGMPGPAILGGFDAVGLGTLGRGLAPDPWAGASNVSPLLGLPGPGLYGGFGQLGQEAAPPPPPGPPPSLGMSSQVLSSERLSTAPPLCTAPPPSPPQAEPVPGAAYISDNPPPRTPLSGHIPTEAPAYVLGTATNAGTTAPLLSSTPLAVSGSTNPADQAGSRRGSIHSAKGDGRGGGSPVDLKGIFGGVGGDPYGANARNEGAMGGYSLGGLGGTGDAADRYSADGGFRGMDSGSAAVAAYAALGAEVQAAAAAGGGRNTSGPWIAGGRGTGRGDGGAGGGEAKGRVPLSGGGPKRTDYIKKYGGSAQEQGEVHVAGQSSQVPITTMMLKNIPCRKSQEEVMMHIDQKGFGNRYDFFYLPRDVKFRANLGYAFINFLTPEDASNFSGEMNGYRFSSSGSMKACAVVPAHVQGLMNNLAAFKRTEVMRSSRRPYFSSMINL